MFGRCEQLLVDSIAANYPNSPRGLSVSGIESRAFTIDWYMLSQTRAQVLAALEMRLDVVLVVLLLLTLFRP